MFFDSGVGENKTTMKIYRTPFLTSRSVFCKTKQNYKINRNLKNSDLKYVT